MTRSTLQLAAVSAALGYLSTVSGHGFMCGPDPEFTGSSGDRTAFIATIPSTVFPSFGPNEDAAKNAVKFAQGMKEGGFPDLRTFLQPYGKECGDTNKNASPRPIPSDGKLCFKNSETEGLTASHHGPCEIWIDDEMILHSDDCVKEYGSQSPTLFPVDYSKCKGTCNLQFYWVALQSADSSGFQVYKNCVPLAGSPAGNSGGGSSVTSPPEQVTSSPIFDAPVDDTPLPVEDVLTPVVDLSTPIYDSPAPVEETPVYSPTPFPSEDSPLPDSGYSPSSDYETPMGDSPSPSEGTPASDYETGYETPMGDSPSPSEGTPATGYETPVGNSPSASEASPSAGYETPMGDSPSPSEGTPATGYETPVGGSPSPSEGTPATGYETPMSGSPSPSEEGPLPNQGYPTPAPSDQDSSPVEQMPSPVHTKKPCNKRRHSRRHSRRHPHGEQYN